MLNPKIKADEKKRYIDALSQNEVEWPSGHWGPIKKSTIYFWIKKYNPECPIESLMRTSKKLPTKKAIKVEWVEFSITLLEEDQNRSFTDLTHHIAEQFKLDHTPSKSSLYREVSSHPKYKKIKKKNTTIFCRFESTHAHQIWQLDGKSKFKVYFKDGTEKTYRLLTIIDDATRYILGAKLAATETTAAAIAVFKESCAEAGGVSENIYADRGSAFEADLFRTGIALFGSHRILTPGGTPNRRGKSEKSHQSTHHILVLELQHRVVEDEQELLKLLKEAIRIYNHRPHHSLNKMSPQQALASYPSRARHVAAQDLFKAFLKPCCKAVCRKTHTLQVGKTYYKVPEEAISKHRKVSYLLDIETKIPYLPRGPQGFEPLKPAIRKTPPGPPALTLPCPTEDVPALEKLEEHRNGRDLPVAMRGFGYPEILSLLSQTLGRKVPLHERESSDIISWLGTYGPFDCQAFKAALFKGRKILGDGCCLKDLLDELTKQIKTKQKG